MFENLEGRNPRPGDHVLVDFYKGSKQGPDPSSPNLEHLMIDEAFVVRILKDGSYRVYSPAVDDVFTVDKSALRLVDN